MKKFFEEFKAFAMRGNVLDMAVGVVLDFIIIAFAVFCMVKAINKMHEKLTGPAEPEPEKEPEPTKEELLLAEIRDLLKEQSK